MSDDHHDSETSQRVRDLEARLVESGALTGEQIDAALDRYLATRGVVTNGARLVARAWVDSDFRRRLLDDANAACEELGLEWSGEEPVFRVVENTDDRHNVDRVHPLLVLSDRLAGTIPALVPLARVPGSCGQGAARGPV